MGKYLQILSLLLLLPLLSIAQQDTSGTVRQDAIYNRPFITMAKARTAVGGYVEGNTNYFSEDGVSEGLSFELRRFNIFLFSQIHSRIRFLSEIEFEHGTEEISVETAMLDFSLHSALNFRGGIILPALGLVNANHDSPNWEFIDRPLSSTDLIPTTLSEVGFGIGGKFYPDTNLIFSYDIYVVNGLQQDVILNAQGRTHIPSGKSPRMFGEDNNGEPMLNARASIARRKWGELGLSYYGGVYNSYRLDGEQVMPKRNLSIFALDYSFLVKRLTVQGEMVYASIDVPDPISEIYGTQQYAGFVEFIYPIVQRSILKFKQAQVNIALRAERIDYNTGQFRTNISEPIGDENTGIAAGLSFRPRPGTVLRLNYRYHWIKDILGNPNVQVAGIQVGIASYF